MAKHYTSVQKKTILSCPACGKPVSFCDSCGLPFKHAERVCCVDNVYKCSWLLPGHYCDKNKCDKL